MGSYSIDVLFTFSQYGQKCVDFRRKDDWGCPAFGLVVKLIVQQLETDW